MPNRDAVALADAIARPAGDLVLCDRLADVARASVLRRFDDRIVINRTFGVYRDLLGHG